MSNYYIALIAGGFGIAGILLAAFDIAWKPYYENEQSQNHPLRQYAAQVQQADGMTNQQKRQLAISRIEAQLKFAEK